MELGLSRRQRRICIHLNQGRAAIFLPQSSFLVLRISFIAYSLVMPARGCLPLDASSQRISKCFFAFLISGFTFFNIAQPKCLCKQRFAVVLLKRGAICSGLRECFSLRVQRLRPEPFYFAYSKPTAFLSYLLIFMVISSFK